MNWVLLRGLAREAGHWLDFPVKFSGRFNCDVITPDLPGMGKRQEDVSPLTVSGIADSIVDEILPTLSNEKWGIFGVSLGAMVSLNIAERYPKLFSKLVLVNPSVSNASPIWKRLRPPAFISLAKIIKEKDKKLREKLILELVSNNEKSREKALETWSDLAIDWPGGVRTAISQITAASHYRAKFKVPIPTLVLTSHGDRMVDHSCGKRIAEKLGATYREHTWAGHELPLDDPEWVIDQIENFPTSMH